MVDRELCLEAFRAQGTTGGVNSRAVHEDSDVRGRRAETLRQLGDFPHEREVRALVTGSGSSHGRRRVRYETERGCDARWIATYANDRSAEACQGYGRRQSYARRRACHDAGLSGQWSRSYGHICTPGSRIESDGFLT